MSERQIAYVTTTRADYGLMTPVLRAVEDSRQLDLQLFCTGMHLLENRGQTEKLVKRDFPAAITIDAKPEGGDEKAMAMFSSHLACELTEQLIQLRPDIMLILGDRQEMLQVAVTAYQLRIPIAHLHGGERTLVDDPARHAISKLASLHLPATKESADRLQRMGEPKERIHVVGAPALDVILNASLPSRTDTFKYLNVQEKEKYILLTLHPSAVETITPQKQMAKTLESVINFGLPVVVIYPNIDMGGDVMIKTIEEFANKYPQQMKPFGNIPFLQFLAVEKHASCWVGNSSAGLLESPAFGVPYVNIGNRQNGRQSGENVIHIGYDNDEIASAIEKSLNDGDYRKKIKKTKNPWGDGKTGPRVAKILESVTLDEKLLNKQIVY